MPNKKRSWRDEAAPKAQRQGQADNWKRDKSSRMGDAKGPLLSKTSKILLLGGTILVGIIVTLVILLWPTPLHAPRLVLISAGYETNLALPHNAYGKRALGELRDWAKEHNKDWGGGEENGIDIVEKTLTTQEDAIAKSLEGYEGKSVVVFLAVHGGADSAGGYLFPDNARPNRGFSSNPDSVLYRLDKVFGALGRLPNDTKKLLIIDATGVTMSWPMGMLKNTFAEALTNHTGRKEIKNLVVLSSSGPNERSWASEQFGRTIFSHFVIEGLKGGADTTKLEGAGDGHITAEELANYVQENVKLWVRQNRAARQNPMLFDEQAAAKDMILIGTLGNYKEPEPRKLASPSGLEAMWEERDRLSKSIPAPYVYTPHLWRRYQDALIRYEELVLAGSNSSSEMKKIVTELSKDIERGQSLVSASLANSLAMPVALNRSLDSRQFTLPADETGKKVTLQAKFGELWRNTETAPRAFSTDIVEKFPSAQREIVRTVVTKLLLDELVRGGESTFERVANILPEVKDVLLPRPIEAQYALEVRRGLFGASMPANARPSWSTIQKSQQVLSLGELAALGLSTEGLGNRASYPEQLMPWIRDSIAKADGERRLAQDLLFVGSSSDDEVTQKLGKQEKAYKSLIDASKSLRDAMHVRDQALAELPYLSRWRSEKMLLDEQNSLANDRIRDQLVPVWGKVHALDKALETPKTLDVKEGSPEQLTDESSGAVRAVKTLSGSIDGELRKLAKDLKDESTDERRQVPQHWHELDALLQVPMIEASVRMRCIQDRRNIAKVLLTKGEAGTEDTSLKEAANASYSEDAAKRQEKLAFATLGQAREKKLIGSRRLNSTETAETIGKGFRDLGEEAKALTDTGVKLPPSEAVSKLREASSRVALLDGATSKAMLTASPHEQKQRVELHRLLVWQAKRAFLDYWVDSASRKPYFREAGNIYLTAANDLLKNPPIKISAEERTARLSESSPVARLLGEDSSVAIHWEKGKTYLDKVGPLHITDEPVVPRTFGLKGSAQAPSGRPVVWSEVGVGLKYSKDTPPSRRTRDKVSANEADSQFTYELIPLPESNRTIARKESKHVVHSFFRGRHSVLETPVWVHYQPDLVAYQPEPPKTASIAIMASDDVKKKLAAFNSHLAIVLDCSATMALEVNADGTTRYDQVITALKAVLEEMPKGMEITVFAFGNRGTNFDKVFHTEQWSQTRAEKARLYNEFRRLTPDKEVGFTPLIYSIFRAGEAFEANSNVAKSIVILTDGLDQGPDNRTHYDINAESFHRNGESVQAFLNRVYPRDPSRKGDRRFGTAITVFGVDVKSNKSKVDQFVKEIESIDGKYFPVTSDVSRLVARLKESLFSVNYFIKERSGVVPIAQQREDGHNVSTVGQDPRPVPGLGEGTYDASLKKSKLHKGIDQLFRLERGDSLILELVGIERDKGLFRRPLYQSLSTFPRKSEVKKMSGTSWHVGVNQNKQVNETKWGLQMMVTIDNEKYFRDGEGYSYQPRPGMAWFSVRLQGKPDDPKGGYPGLRFYPLYHYPSPAWSLDYVSWPYRRKPIVDVYWSEEGSRPDLAKVLSRGKDYSNPTQLKQAIFPARVSNTETTDVTIESVQPIRQKVLATPGSPLKDEDCLVVRMSFPDGTKPFFIQLPEEIASKLEGHEHKFYENAGKYTGIFWPISKETIREIEHLDIISVEQFRKNSFHSTFQLGEPDDSDNRPPTIGEK